MKRLGVLVLALLFCGGCLTEEMKKEWQEAWKDLRGDNMEMRSGPIDRSLPQGSLGVDASPRRETTP